MHNDANTRTDLKQYWRMAWRRRWLILLPIIAIVSIAMGGTFLVEPVYEASTTILVEDGLALAPHLQQLVLSERALGYRTSDFSVIRARISSSRYTKELARRVSSDQQLSILSDTNRLDSLSSVRSADTTQMNPAALFPALSRSISIRQLGPHILQLSASWSDPDTALRIADLAAKVLIDQAMEDQLQEVFSIHTFGLEQLAFYQQQLADKEEELRKLTARSVRASNGTQPLADDELNEIRSFRDQLAADMVRIESLLENIDTATWVAASKVPLEIGLTGGQREKLLSLARQIATLLVEKDWTDPRILALGSQIQEIETRVREAYRAATAQRFPALSEADREEIVELRMNEISLERLGAQVDQLDALVRTQRWEAVAKSREQMEIDRLEQEVESARQITAMLTEQTKATELSHALEQVRGSARYKMLDGPRRPSQPVRPDRMKIALMAFSLGSLLGFGLAFLAEFGDHSLHTVEEAEAELNLTVLGTIPRIPRESRQYTRKR
jgi:succinoglycan biosynthesis transport protein ExoP